MNKTNVLLIAAAALSFSGAIKSGDEPERLTWTEFERTFNLKSMNGFSKTGHHGFSTSTEDFVFAEIHKHNGDAYKISCSQDTDKCVVQKKGTSDKLMLTGENALTLRGLMERDLEVEETKVRAISKQVFDLNIIGNKTHEYLKDDGYTYKIPYTELHHKIQQTENDILRSKPSQRESLKTELTELKKIEKEWYDRYKTARSKAVEDQQKLKIELLEKAGLTHAAKLESLIFD